jgi:hypothetical protein
MKVPAWGSCNIGGRVDVKGHAKTRVNSVDLGAPILTYYLVPVHFAGYILVVDPVADLTPMPTRSRVAARQPVPYQHLYLLVREPVAQLYRRVTRYGGEAPLCSSQALYPSWQRMPL